MFQNSNQNKQSNSNTSRKAHFRGGSILIVEHRPSVLPGAQHKNEWVIVEQKNFAYLTIGGSKNGLQLKKTFKSYH